MAFRAIRDPLLASLGDSLAEAAHRRHALDHEREISLTPLPGSTQAQSTLHLQN
ncbi:MAG: hypothetical protein NW237_02325 [Cyanobacteriota bacterium]|nr:hypothetical protein [Cyanobacteriota bacterium]